jgi:hypothetical protein
MTHKVARLKLDRHIYIETEVPIGRSVSQILAMLEKSGCTRIMNTKDLRGDIPLYSVAFEREGVPFLLEFPIVYEKRRGGSDRLNMNLSGRIVHDRIKSLLIWVEIDAMSFSEAMFQFLALPDKTTGQGITLMEYAMQHGDNLLTGAFDVCALPAPKTGGVHEVRT